MFSNISSKLKGKKLNNLSKKLKVSANPFGLLAENRSKKKACPKHNVWFWLQFWNIFYIFSEHYNPLSATRLSEDSQLPLWNASQSQPDYSFEARGQLHPPASMDFEASSHQAYPNVLGFTNASPLTFQYNSNLFPYQQLSPFENNRPTYL